MNTVETKGSTYEKGFADGQKTMRHQKGRALSAARLGLKSAIEVLDNEQSYECEAAAEEARAALKRSYRMENDGSEQTAA